MDEIGGKMTNPVESQLRVSITKILKSTNLYIKLKLDMTNSPDFNANFILFEWS